MTQGCGTRVLYGLEEELGAVDHVFVVVGPGVLLDIGHTVFHRAALSVQPKWDERVSR